MWAKQRGFTIVELLIVIVVIGILAAITIVAFNGIQNRANNSKTVSAVRGYVTALKAYEAVNGSFPNVRSCLGYGYAAGRCHDSDGTMVEDGGTLNTVLLKPYMENPPVPHVAKGAIAGTYVAGAIYALNDASYNPSGAGVNFVQLGASSCPSIAGTTIRVSSLLSNNEGMYCRVNIN